MITATPLLLDIPLSEPAPAALDGALVPARQVALVRLTSGNAVAYGEAGLTDPQALPEVLDFLTDLLGTADPTDHDLLWQRMAWSLRDYQPTPLADYTAVLSAVDVAVWDLAGQLLGQPCWRLLGGARSRRVDAYAAGLHAAAPPTLTRDTKAIRQRFGSLQLRLTGDQEVDTAAAATVRSAAGDTALLRLDAGCSYPDAEQVRGLVTALGPAEPFWLMDPLPLGNWETWAQLCPDLPMALAGGRGLTGLKTAAQALSLGAVDILTPDLRLCGGLSAGRRLADVAWIHGAAIAFAGAYSPLTQLAAAHLAAATLHASCVEMEGLPGPFAEMLEPPVRVVDGFLMLPDGPGLGSRVSERFIARYQRELSGT
ncbi:MAG: hypothetical protein HPY69_15910 [Armatimonadetes bacterium]|nr:hypothetical protein [Armatimonadota bacterium]